MIYKNAAERDERLLKERSSRDCEACGGMASCSDCGKLNTYEPKEVDPVWLNSEQVYIDPSLP